MFGMLTAHLDADPAAPESVRLRAYIADPSAPSLHEKYLANRRGTAFGVPRDAYANAVAAMHSMESRESEPSAVEAVTVPAATATPFWTALGPLPITNQVPIFGTDPIGGALASASGKVTAIAVDPTTSGRLFIGTSGGGVWMSTNGGTSFTSIFEAQPTLAIGAVTLDPTTSPPTIYVGTGEGNNTVDSYFGLGLFISTDLGNTWVQNTGGGAFTDLSCSRIAIDTTKTPRVIYAAMSTGSSSNRAGVNFIESNVINNGLWKSPDGGMTWSQVPFTSQLACPNFGGFCPAEDVAIDPSGSFQRFYRDLSIRGFRLQQRGRQLVCDQFPRGCKFADRSRQPDGTEQQRVRRTGSHRWHRVSRIFQSLRRGTRLYSDSSAVRESPHLDHRWN